MTIELEVVKGFEDVIKMKILYCINLQIQVALLEPDNLLIRGSKTTHMFDPHLTVDQGVVKDVEDDQEVWDGEGCRADCRDHLIGKVGYSYRDNGLRNRYSGMSYTDHGL